MSDIGAHVVRTTGLTHRYRDTRALDGIDLSIPAGCMAGLIGPDGVGKSTLLALTAGVRAIQEGTLEALGGDMRRAAHRRSVCPRIAYMPQGIGRNLYMSLSVFENVEFFARLFGLARREREHRIDELLTSTGLSPFRDRAAGKLSGGMKQKLGLCCALIHDPDLLILDEPTTGVDPLSRRQFWALVNHIRAQRPETSLIISTAYMDEAEQFDWLAALDGGKLLASGDPSALRARTQTDSLEAAFVALLPDHKRRGHKRLRVPPNTRHTEGPAAIQAKSLTKRFDGFTAVDAVSFEIHRGEIFGFLGSNGCGKTTTMKMLTGLLPVTEGEAYLFGKRARAQDLAMRERVGYMSQLFSLYGELTVMQNLDLHARLYHLPAERRRQRVGELVDTFGLEAYRSEVAAELPLGIRQRLSLAVAVVHQPEILILDEPTSGVDPVARDEFWRLIIDLSREQGVTIFISTHFMNEATRCDRISFMHAGRVLAQGTPAELIESRNAKTLEQAFIAYLEAAAADPRPAGESEALAAIPRTGATRTQSGMFSLTRLLAYARRESLELLRDPIRLAFALLSPLILMVVFGYGISFDVENLRYAVLDQDRTPQSRRYLENFQGSRYFGEQSPILDHRMLESRLQSGELRLAIEIPPDFGKALKRERQPEVAVWLDGAMPFRAETSRGYVEGVHQRFLQELTRASPVTLRSEGLYRIETRFRYNQDFKSIFAMVPGTLMLMLVFIPAMMTAVGVVREKEMGSIANLYATPVTGLEFLLGKQLPYVAVAYINFICLILLAYAVFEVPVQGSLAALAFGALLYVATTTGFALMVSTFVRTQIAAIFATAIITTLPAINFSGLFTPVASLTGAAKVMGYLFPNGYFQMISVGTFNKGLRFEDLGSNFLALGAIAVAYLGLALALLRTQER